MGMITRVRARLRSCQSLYGSSSSVKIPLQDVQLPEEGSAQKICVLSVLLLLPYLTRPAITPSSSVLLSAVGVAYTCLVLPMMASAQCRYDFHVVRLLEGIATKTWRCVMSVVRHVQRRCLAVEQNFLKMPNISNLLCQLLIFSMCDKVLVPRQKLTALYSLMFYNVMAYCFTYVKELATKQDWSLSINLTSHSSIRHLAMSTTKIVFEWTKAVTFIITLVFMLLVFGLEQGLQHYQPTFLYLVVTTAYYLVTEKIFTDWYPAALTFCKFEVLEAAENLWAPFLSKLIGLIIAGILVILTLLHGRLSLALTAGYFCVFLKGREWYNTEFRQLESYNATLQKYRFATWTELEEHDDVCAVCLCPMRYARITPCQHVFHGECLRKCLLTSNRCPLCKRELKFD